MEKYFKKEYLLLLLFITSLPAIIYFLNFVCSDIKSTPETWAQFGDFLGGTTNVILGLINIIVTIYLALIIKNLDKSRLDEQKELESLRHQQNLDTQHKLFSEQIKFNAYNEFNLLFGRIYNSMLLNRNAEVNLEFKRNVNSFVLFIRGNKNLFKTLNLQIIKDLEIELRKVLSEYEDWDDNESEKKLVIITKNIETTLQEVFIEFQNELNM
ncbi:hypothetical protein ACTS9D_00775 [Empedobacter brevis]